MCNFRKQNASQSSHSLHLRYGLYVCYYYGSDIIDTFRSRVAIKLDFTVVCEGCEMELEMTLTRIALPKNECDSRL